MFLFEWFKYECDDEKLRRKEDGTGIGILYQSISMSRNMKQSDILKRGSKDGILGRYFLKYMDVLKNILDWYFDTKLSFQLVYFDLSTLNSLGFSKQNFK